MKNKTVFPRPWKIFDTGYAFHIEDSGGRSLAYVYYRRDGALLDLYLTPEQADEMAQAIARLSRPENE